RPGTAAAAMSGHVPVNVARDRTRILRELSDQKKARFMRSFIGQEIEAITLNQSSSGDRTEALTDNYLNLLLSDHYASNQRLTAQVVDVEEGALLWQALADRNSAQGTGSALINPEMSSAVPPSANRGAA